MDAYDLTPDLDYLHLWTVGTPGLISGNTALVAQTAILPRVVNRADLAGDLESEGRRTVTGTRGRKLLSYHQCVECFRNGDVPKVWSAYHRYIFKEGGKGCIVQNIDAAAAGTKLASMRDVVTPMCFENHAFQVLAKAMADLPKYATNSLRRFPSLHDYYEKENGGEMLRTMTTVADELINEVLKNFTNKTPMYESNTSFHEDNELE